MEIIPLKSAKWSPKKFWPLSTRPFPTTTSILKVKYRPILDGPSIPIISFDLFRNLVETKHGHSRKRMLRTSNSRTNRQRNRNSFQTNCSSSCSWYHIPFWWPNRKGSHPKLECDEQTATRAQELVAHIVHLTIVNLSGPQS